MSDEKCKVCNGTGLIYPENLVDQSQFDPDEYQSWARMGGYRAYACPACIGRAVTALESLKPSVRLKVLKLFCARCGEQNCNNGRNCYTYD